MRDADFAGTQGVQAIRLEKYGSTKSEAGERMWNGKIEGKADERSTVERKIRSCLE